MNRIDMRDLTLLPDPDTDQRLLPDYLCRAENNEEMACYKLALRLAMEQFLAEDQRQIIHMRFWLGMSMAEIGSELGLSRSAATKRVTAVLAILRERVGFCVEVYNALTKSAGNDS